MRRLRSNGDTIVEVLLALTLLSAILFTSWSIINRSAQISAAAQKRIVMVNKVKEQAEILKSLYANETTRPLVNSRRFTAGQPILPLVFNVDMGPAGTRVPINPCENRPAGNIVPFRGFHFNEDGVVQTGAKTGSVPGDEAVWIQMNQPQGAVFTDFYIRACWRSGAGASQKDDNTQIIVRLNL